MKIRIGDTITESFNHVRTHYMHWVRVAVAPVTIGVLGFAFFFLMMLAAGQSMDMMSGNMAMDVHGHEAAPTSPLVGFGGVVFFITYLIAILGLYINGFRYGILNEGGESWWTLHLNWRMFRMFLYFLLIMVIAGAYALLAVGVTVGSGFLIESVALGIFLGILFFIFGIYILTRLMLIFPLVSIDDKTPLGTSWKLLEGNILRFIGLWLLISLIVMFISFVGILAVGFITMILGLISAWLATLGIILMIVFYVGLWIFSWAFFSKALSTVYLTLSGSEGK